MGFSNKRSVTQLIKWHGLDVRYFLAVLCLTCIMLGSWTRPTWTSVLLGSWTKPCWAPVMSNTFNRPCCYIRLIGQTLAWQLFCCIHGPDLAWYLLCWVHGPDLPGHLLRWVHGPDLAWHLLHWIHGLDLAGNLFGLMDQTSLGNLVTLGSWTLSCWVPVTLGSERNGQPVLPWSSQTLKAWGVKRCGV